VSTSISVAEAPARSLLLPYKRPVPRGLPYSGVFSYRDGQLRLEATDLTGPNGVAFSPDERFLYVTNWDTA
jgi:sugar lactone lactonase YvrE